MMENEPRPKVEEQDQGGTETNEPGVVRIRFSAEEQDKILAQAVAEEMKVFNLTPGVLRRLKQRRH